MMLVIDVVVGKTLESCGDFLQEAVPGGGNGWELCPLARGLGPGGELRLSRTFTAPVELLRRR